MKRFSSFFGAALTVLLLTLAALPATAAPTSSGLSITPRKNHTIEPGQSITDKLTIGNLNSQADLNVSLKMIDFTYSDTSGTPKLLLAANAPQTLWSLKPFTTLPASVVVPAGQTKAISYTIKIPQTQGAGSYYGAIEYAANGNNGGNVSLNASGVTLVFVSVPGTVREDMSLQKFGAYRSDDGGVGGSFMYLATARAPQQLAFSLKNNGNVVESPAGSIVLKDMFGHQVKVIGNANPGSSVALLGQNRLFVSCITTTQQQVTIGGQTTTAKTCADPHLKPGKYTASLDIFYGQNGNKTHELTAMASFWYVPWWFIIAVGLGIIVVAALVWWLQRKLRKLTHGPTYHRPDQNR